VRAHTKKLSVGSTINLL